MLWCSPILRAKHSIIISRYVENAFLCVDDWDGNRGSAGRRCGSIDLHFTFAVYDGPVSRVGDRYWWYHLHADVFITALSSPVAWSENSGRRGLVCRQGWRYSRSMQSAFIGQVGRQAVSIAGPLRWNWAAAAAGMAAAAVTSLAAKQSCWFTAEQETFNGCSSFLSRPTAGARDVGRQLIDRPHNKSRAVCVRTKLADSCVRQTISAHTTDICRTDDDDTDWPLPLSQQPVFASLLIGFIDSIYSSS